MTDVTTDTAPETKNESVLEEAKNLLVQGKRFMALEDYHSATDHLEQAVQLFDAYYGVGKIQSADAYLEYGLALVALANLEAGSGTDKIMKKAGIEGEIDEEEVEDEEGEDEEEEEEGEGEATENKEGADNNDNETARSEGPKPDEAIDSGKKTENGSSNSNGQEVTMETDESTSNGLNKANGASTNNSVAPEEPKAGTSSGKTGGEGGDEDEEDNEATTIEIAWEVLCLAKRLFMTDESLEGRLKLAETYQKLGEISIEWDNNDNAVSILEECLNIRKAILPPEDRLIALTYYNLGLAHSFKSEIDKANENFQNAVTVIEKRIETLSKDLEKAKEAQDTLVVSSYDKEINELKELLPDIMMRMDDSKDDQEKSNEVLKRTREEIQSEDEQVKKVLLDKSKPVDDISHLVKRRAT